MRLEQMGGEVFNLLINLQTLSEDEQIHTPKSSSTASDQQITKTCSLDTMDSNHS